MASRRTYRCSKIVQNQDYDKLNIGDVLCPICRSIFIEPVTLPCNHSFCNCCFEATVENANLVCPLCRIRIGSWIRRAKKESRIINEPFWQNIKDRFPEQIKNRLNGIEEDLEQEPTIILSCPGEVRKEYEMQKQKEEEEMRKRKEVELKASEELINKLKAEEEYQQVVREEKLKFDEAIAKKLAAEFSLNSPSTSKTNSNSKRLGPMDKFLKKDKDYVTPQNNLIKKDSETVTSLNQNYLQNRNATNFAEKEYTCRILYLDNRKSETEPRKSFSPIMRRKIQQIQKIVDTENNSDSSDCIESEMRYFKPINHKSAPPSQGKSPIKILPRKACKNGMAQIVSPGGLINFHSNMLESAFARISLTPPTVVLSDDSPVSPEEDGDKLSKKLKRPLEEDESDVPTKKIDVKAKMDKNDTAQQTPKSPLLKSMINFKKRFLEKCKMSLEDSSSPPFYGYDELQGARSLDRGRKNGVLADAVEDMQNKLLQEQSDLEFAKKLQEELNRPVHNTRGSQRRESGNFRIHKRQTTLDELLNNSYRVNY